MKIMCGQGSDFPQDPQYALKKTMLTPPSQYAYPLPAKHHDAILWGENSYCLTCSLGAITSSGFWEIGLQQIHKDFA